VAEKNFSSRRPRVVRRARKKKRRGRGGTRRRLDRRATPSLRLPLRPSIFLCIFKVDLPPLPFKMVCMCALEKSAAHQRAARCDAAGLPEKNIHTARAQSIIS
jgi:hypothetical protein